MFSDELDQTILNKIFDKLSDGKFITGENFAAFTEMVPPSVRDTTFRNVRNNRIGKFGFKNIIGELADPESVIGDLMKLAQSRSEATVPLNEGNLRAVEVGIVDGSGGGPAIAPQFQVVDPVVNPDRILYVPCQHGTSPTLIHEVIYTRCDYNRLLHYAEPYKVLPFDAIAPFVKTWYDQFDYVGGPTRTVPRWQDNPTFRQAILTGSYVSKMATYQNKRYATIPPLLFIIQKSDLTGDKHFNVTMGVWRVVIRGNQITEVRNIVDAQTWAQTLGFDQLVTASTLFRHLNAVVLANGDRPDAVEVGLASCHDQAYYESVLKTPMLQGTGITSYDNATVVSPSAIFDRTIFLSHRPDAPINGGSNIWLVLVTSTAPLHTNWEPLAKQTVVGCGMNTLAYYGIINQAMARTRVCALPVKGQSIFSVYSLIRLHYPQDNKFIVTRFPIQHGVGVIMHLMTEPIAVGSAIIIKIYDVHDNPSGGFSHLGHTISIYNNGTSLMLIDPQAKIFVHFTTAQELYGLLSHYYPTKKFMDIVFGVGNQNNPARSYLTYDQYNALGGTVVPLVESIDFGGSRKRKRKRTHKL